MKPDGISSGRHWAALALVSLVACSNREPKTPVAPGERLLADRLDAMEADMATIEAEMQELRVRYLPIDEMSDDEFERHVQKRLEKAPPEQKEAIEKDLRAKRKSSTLSGKALVSYWDDRFAKDATNDPWSKQAATACRPKMEKALPTGGKLRSFECRKERCRADVFSPTEGSAVDEALNICAEDAELFSGATVISRITKSNGSVTAIVYVVRKGYTMNIE